MTQNQTTSGLAVASEVLFCYDHFEVTKMPFSSYENIDPVTGMPTDTEYDRFINDAYGKALKAHMAAGEGVKKEKMCHVPVGDGYAVYVITKVNPKGTRCTLEWRGFGGADNYVDARWGYKITVPVAQANIYMAYDLTP